MNRKDFIDAYEPIPQALGYRVRYTLEHLEEAPAARLPKRTAILVLALVLALCGVGYAFYESITASLFGWFYGDGWKEELAQGDMATMGQSYLLGDAVYTVEEMVYKKQGEHKGLYGVVRVAPAEGAKVVLVAEDVSVHDPAGYALHYGDTGATLTDDAVSYAELAEANGARLVSPVVRVNSLMVDDADYSACFGVACLPQADGSILITLEMTDGLPRAESYALELSLCNTLLTQSGLPDRDAAQEWYDWSLTVAPDMKEE